MTLWVVRGGRRGERERYNLSRQVCTLGWPGISDLVRLGSQEEIRDEVRRLLGSAKEKAIQTWSSHLFSFAHRIEPGDLIAMPLRDGREVAFGQVVGSYGFDADAPEEIGPHRLPVKWADLVPRADIDEDILRAMSRPSGTVFQPRSAVAAEERVKELIGLR